MTPVTRAEVVAVMEAIRDTVGSATTEESTSGSQGFALRQHAVEAHVLTHAGASVHQTLQRLGKARRVVVQHGHLHGLSCQGRDSAPIVLLGKDGRPQRRRRDKLRGQGGGRNKRKEGSSPADEQSAQHRRHTTPTGVAPGSPAGHKRAAESGQVADGNAGSPARRGSNTGKVAARSTGASPRRMLPPDASELDVSIGTPPARAGAASTALAQALFTWKVGDPDVGLTPAPPVAVQWRVRDPMWPSGSRVYATAAWPHRLPSDVILTSSDVI